MAAGGGEVSTLFEEAPVIDPLSYILMGLYALLCVFCFIQLGRILYYRHNLISYQVGFLFLCLLWTLLRVIFWAVQATDNDEWWSTLIFWLPINIQFATFSLLALYYANMTYLLKNKAVWETKYRNRCYAAYVIVNVVLLILNAVWVGVASGGASEAVQEVHAIFSGTVFLFLAIVLAFYGWQVSHTNIYKIQTPFQAKSTSPILIKVLTFIIFLSFATRCTFDFVTRFSSVRVPIEDGLTVLSFLLYILWEIMPTLLVLLFFRKIPRTRLGKLNRFRETFVPVNARDEEGLEASDRQQPSTTHANKHLFENPQRYDSDDEVGTMKNAIPRPAAPFASQVSGSQGGYGCTPVSVGSNDDSLGYSRNYSYGSPCYGAFSAS